MARFVRSLSLSTWLFSLLNLRPLLLVARLFFFSSLLWPSQPINRWQELCTTGLYCCLVCLKFHVLVPLVSDDGRVSSLEQRTWEKDSWRKKKNLTKRRGRKKLRKNDERQKKEKKVPWRFENWSPAYFSLFLVPLLLPHSLTIINVIRLKVVVVYAPSALTLFSLSLCVYFFHSFPVLSASWCIHRLTHRTLQSLFLPLSLSLSLLSLLLVPIHMTSQGRPILEVTRVRCPEAEAKKRRRKVCTHSVTLTQVRAPSGLKRSNFKSVQRVMQ